MTSLLAAAEIDPEPRPLVLVGSSMGNATTLSVTAALSAPACAVVAISPVPASGPLDGTAAFRSLPHGLTPASLHLTWAEDDGNVPAHVTQLGDAAHSLSVRLEKHPVEGDAHSITLVREHEDAANFVQHAVAGCH